MPLARESASRLSGLNLFGIEGGWYGVFLYAWRRGLCDLRASSSSSRFVVVVLAFLVRVFPHLGHLVGRGRYVQDSPLQRQAEFAAHALQAFSLQQLRECIDKSKPLGDDAATTRPSWKSSVKQVTPALTDKNTELWTKLERRLFRLESSVGDDAACVRNISSFETLGGCVHLVSGSGVSTVCGWKFEERAHMRLARETALRLPAAQRCEVCWVSNVVALDIVASSSRSSSSSSGSSSRDPNGTQ